MLKKIAKKMNFGSKSSQKSSSSSSIASVTDKGTIGNKVEALTLINKPREFDEFERNNNFFFIHIPKTAGTSFRKALEDDYTVLGDYGVKSTVTDSIIKQAVYELNSPFLLKSEFKKMQNTWLTGHVNLAKYSDMVSARHIIAFVRDPVQQVLSHYNHYVAHNGFEGTLDKFLKQAIGSNFQTRNLMPLPLGLIGYVGLTGHYNESIRLINGYYGLDLAVKNVNINNKKTINNETISIALREQISDLNLLDIAYVEEATYLHKQRVALIEEDKEWVYSHFSINPNNVLNGCAYYSHSAKPVELEIFCNDEIIGAYVAEQFFGAFPKVNFPRDRYIGLHIPLGTVAKKDDKITIFAKDTGQQLTYTSLEVKK